MKNEKWEMKKTFTKYFVKVYGCQYNEWDAARISYMLNNIGLEESTEKDADVIFALSCSVRKSAVDRIMGMVKNWQGKKVVITGCVLPNDKPKYLKKNVILWDNKKPEELGNILQLPKQFNDLTTCLPVGKVQQFNNERSFASSYLPIMTGCNNFCSYCAVPYTRGREISRPFDEIISDFQKLVEKGYKEIMLLGQNVNSYGQNHESRIANHGKGSKTAFAMLLETLNNIPGDFLISFTSNHPKDMSDDIIAAVKDLPKVKKEIHLPLQSGSNKILKAMNRPYTKEEYLELINKIKLEIPKIKITTDTIIGFPGETEEDFQETISVLKEVNYLQSYNNKYSPRMGTAAFKLGDPIPWEEKERRWRILNEITNKK